MDYLLPGADIVTDTSSSHTVTGVGPSLINVGHGHAGTTSVQTSLASLTIGTLTWPDGTSPTCTTTDPAHPGT